MPYQLTDDPARRSGRTLFIDGVQQSYVDVDDPTYLRFGYVRRMGSIVDTVAGAGVPIRALHLGAGAMTLTRYIEATRPGSRQVVVDHDPALVDFVRERLPLPAGADIQVDITDARAACAAAAGADFDLILTDVYRGAQMAPTVSTVEFATLAVGALHDDGVFTTNLADLPPLAFSRIQAATLRAVFGDVCAIAEAGMLRGRRYGNVVLAAARAGRLPVSGLVRRAGRDLMPVRLLHGDELDAFIGGAAAHHDPGP